MKTSLAVLFAATLARLVLAGPPSENDPIPKNETCGLEYESVFGTRRADQNYAGCSHRNSYTSLFTSYDVYYTGSVTVQWNGNAPCKANNGPSANNRGTLRIGQMQHPTMSNVTRAFWDNNPFWYSFKSWNSSACGVASDNTKECPPGIDARSGNDQYWWGQWWTMTSNKIADGSGYSISGNLTTKHTNGASNGYHIKTLECTSDSSYANFIVTYKDAISMTGTVTPSTANLSFTVGKVFTDYSSTGKPLSVQPTFIFSGTKVSGGAKLVTSGPNIGTEGSDINDYNAASDATAKKVKKLAYYIGGGVGGLALLCIALCCCCCMMRNKKKRKGVYVAPTYGQGMEMHDQGQGPPPPQYQYGNGKEGPYESYSNVPVGVYQQR
ncbi:hypothetical protein B0J14DRAFT_1846 [Halenospora varia]|nr:hypothetical protein B0J14DRAFT_1846 [Halenospora varia]